MTQALSHYLQFKDLTAQDYAYLFSRAAFIKHKFKTYAKHQPLTDRSLAMIFEKASTAHVSALKPVCTKWVAQWFT
jgi:ornithine carbamoyltransferase